MDIFSTELHKKIDTITPYNIKENLFNLDEWTMNIRHELHNLANKVTEEALWIEETSTTRNQYSDVTGVRYHARSKLWTAEIRHNYISFQLGYHGKGEAGYNSAVNARKEAEAMMEMGFEFFQKWFEAKYPDYAPINRKQRNYVK